MRPAAQDVDLSHEVSLTVGSLAGDAAAPPERQSTVGESLQLLADRLASPTQRTGPPVYLAAWDYVSTLLWGLRTSQPLRKEGRLRTQVNTLKRNC
eukprot:6180066-Pleurochrysis_carterae.AAC.1